MCGIAGIVKCAIEKPLDIEERLLLMNKAMNHRGPDDGGVFLAEDRSIGLANRRLAIRDLSPLGHMPMANDAQDVVITYNGEIYNADELRLELKLEGFSFRSNSDTEVILHGYECWGNDVVPRLRGMFAFAIYDFRHRHMQQPKILLARDHMGIKPIYYWQTPTTFVFASEIKALMASGLITREVDPAGLVGYLLTGSVPNPLTIYRDIQALEPSTYLVIERSNTLRVHPTTYWSLPTHTEAISSLDEAVERCRISLAEAVRICLVSDVPLGAFLSGGLDSSSVVALMRQATTGPIRTCSMVFEEAEYSEAPYARAVADAVGAEHYERVITLEDMQREFENILHALDQPSVDGVNTYFVSQTARQAGLTVALSGLGGDELFGGYPNTFREVPRVRNALALAHQIPAGVMMANAAINLLPNRARWARVQDALQQSPTLASAYMTRRGLFSPSEVRQLVTRDIWDAAVKRSDVVEAVALRANTSDQNPHDSFAWISRAELRTYTHHQLLRDTDAMSMIHSLEVRVPLLDRQLVTTILTMPEWVKKLNNEQPKPLLVRAMRGLLPDIVLNRRDKQGFTFPFAVWLRGALAKQTSEAIFQAADAGFFQADAAAKLFEQFQRGEIHWSRVWSLAALASAA